MSFVGYTVTFDDVREGIAKTYIVVEDNEDGVRAMVDPFAGVASFRPRIVRNMVDGEIVTAYRSAALIKQTIYNLTVALTSKTLGKSDTFNRLVPATLRSLRQALDVTLRYIPDDVPRDLSSFAVEAIGPNHLLDDLIVLRDLGEDMLVVPSDPELGMPLCEIKKSEWVFYSPRSGRAGLRSLCDLPNSPPLLHKFLQRWSVHESN